MNKDKIMSVMDKDRIKRIINVMGDDEFRKMNYYLSLFIDAKTWHWSVKVNRNGGSITDEKETNKFLNIMIGNRLSPIIDDIGLILLITATNYYEIIENILMYDDDNLFKDINLDKVNVIFVIRTIIKMTNETIRHDIMGVR